ncbi:MAG: Ig-like domain-containing protein, partial [Candidatus Nealsonbacteria bacterium]
MKWLSKIFILSVVCLLLSFLLAGADMVFSIIFPPKIINLFPENAAQNVATDSRIIINFNKPINEQALEYSILPQAYGEWKFENPLIKNQLFKTLIFEPAANLNENTTYEIKIEDIKGFGNTKNNSFSFNFKTIDNQNQAQVLVIKDEATSTQPEITLIKTIFNFQKYSLSCEVASLKMALSAKGINVSEDQIMTKIGYDPTPHENGVWGDPNVAFVGDIDGKICDTGYGVHWGPL